MENKRRFLSIRIDRELFERVTAHQKRLQATTPEAVVVSARAAIEDLIRRGLRGVEQ